MNVKRLVVLVIGDRPILSLPVLRALGQTDGIDVHYLSPNSTSASGWSRYVGHHEVFTRAVSTKQRLDALQEMIRRLGVDILLGVDEKAIIFLADHQALLSPYAQVAPVPESAKIRRVGSKSQLAGFLSDHHVPHPATVLWADGRPFDERVSALAFPVLLKPSRSIGGKGIRRFETKDELLRSMKNMQGLQSGFLVQEVVEGFDIDCSLLARDGTILAYTIQKWWVPPTKPFKPPAGIQFVAHQGALDVARQLCSLLQWNGVMHIDMRWDQRDDTVKVLEINPRYWSSLLGSLAVGVNFPFLHCQLTRGIDFPLPAYRQEGFLVERRAAIKELAMNAFRWRHDRRLRFDQTSLKYTLRDPLPDLMNLLKGDAEYREAEEHADEAQG